jgi:hypothetical protein
LIVVLVAAGAGDEAAAPCSLQMNDLHVNEYQMNWKLFEVPRAFL